MAEASGSQSRGSDGSQRWVAHDSGKVVAYGGSSASHDGRRRGLGRQFVRILGLSLVQLSSHLPYLICQTLNGGSCLLLKLHILDDHLPH